MELTDVVVKRSGAYDLLAKPIQRWIWNKGWDGLRDIQEQAIPVLLDEDTDLVVAAATASGKTEAVFLPLLSATLERPSSAGFDLVYIGPTKSLINDQFERLQDLCENLELPVYPWHGDIAQNLKERARNYSRGVLLITPEALEALFVRRGDEVPTYFSSVHAIVIDELHALLDNERGVHLRSLLTRIEIAVERKIRRVGLSATLGDMALVRKYLRPEAPDSVRLLQSASDLRKMQVQIRGYIEKFTLDDGEINAQVAITNHLFDRLRGFNNLIFAQSRKNVESYADQLRQKCENARVPNEFFPHHASLSGKMRLDIEHRLKSTDPVTAVCTSTLEIGIDIGDIACVAQIGSPYSAASLHQRLGRSGRRPGQPAQLRLYVPECFATHSSHPIDRLRLKLIRAIAMVELIIEGWCEPPQPQSLHLSTLVHQILSVIAENSGARAANIFNTLCRAGPFQMVDEKLFMQVLHQMGSANVKLLEQASDGLLLLGEKGEKLVNFYTFFAVFQTPREYRIFAEGRQLGVLPIVMLVSEGMTIVFSGRRWRIESIDYGANVIHVSSTSAKGSPPYFGGGSGLVHDNVVRRMRQLLSDDYTPKYLDSCARSLLDEARLEYRNLGLDSTSMVKLGRGNVLLATWAGTVKTSTLAIALRTYGCRATVYDGLLDVTETGATHWFREKLSRMTMPQGFDEKSLANSDLNLVTEKFHPFLSRELLLRDALSGRIDFDVLPEVVAQILRDT